MDVGIVEGTLRADWAADQLGGAEFVIDGGADVTTGSFEFELAVFPQTTGTVLSATWEDPQGYIISAFVDGDDFVLSHYDAETTETSFPGGEPHDGRTRFRLRSAEGMVFAEAGDKNGFDTIATLDTASSSTPFDGSAAVATLFFNRYAGAGIPAAIAIESVTTCFGP